MQGIGEARVDLRWIISQGKGQRDIFAGGGERLGGNDFGRGVGAHNILPRAGPHATGRLGDALPLDNGAGEQARQCCTVDCRRAGTKDHDCIRCLLTVLMKLV